MEAAIRTVLNEQNGNDFVKKVLNDADSFALFIESVLLDKSTSQKGKEACLDSSTPELVLSIYEKLADSLKDPAAQEYAHELQNEYILVGATLFDLAAAYGETQPGRVRTLLSDLCNYAPWLLSEIEASSDLLVDQISQFRNKLEECSQVRHVEDSGRLIESMCTDLELQTSISAGWLALAAFCTPAAGALMQDNRFIVELAKTWDVVSKQMINVKTVVCQDRSETIGRFENLAKGLKWRWSSLVFCTLQELSIQGKSKGLDLTRDQAPGMGHYAAFLDILNTMETLDAPLVPFVNSPFLLDIEFRFGLRQILEEAANIDKPQLDYLVMSIDQLVDMAEPLYRSGFYYLNERINTMQAVDLAGSSDEPGSRRARDSTAGDKGDNQGNHMAIVQIRELLPDLGAGFICACLDHYGQNVETVIGAILENSLPSELADMDRTTETWAPLKDYNTSDESGSEYASASEDSPDVQPATSVLDSRRNIFDNDEFDIFNRDSLDWSRVSKGKTRKPSDNNTPGNQLKSRIMEIAQRMDEEDEYDDTYDETAQDGAVDTLDADDLTTRNAQEKAEGGKRKEGVDARETSVDPTRPWEEVLVRQYMSNPDVLERNKASRNLPGRQALKTQTGLSDEQLEGWYIMFQRNPRQKNVLMRKYESLGNQNRINTAPLDSEHPPLPSRDRNSKGKNANGKDSSDQQTTNPTAPAPNYKNKNRNKAKIANHNRKQQHDRKTRQAMSGFGGQSL
ncbi:hypothetical protein LPJ59_001338 [Coemansia sp. RSA 2399]|nr:hypothetical protein LPJ59_001338 [Coemansia sp. RSA 2399]KAJ1906701.1 hypothetical protein LPJ81_001209 [Coemansia sp. IMI 209127]